MKIMAVPQVVFDHFVTKHKITPENVEQQDKFLFISLNNTFGSTPYFPRDKKNVKVLLFDDVDQNIIISSSTYVPGDNKYAFSEEDAKDLFGFIRDNIDGKEVVLIHCDEFLNRSTAVATFIEEYLGRQVHVKTLDKNHQRKNERVYNMLIEQLNKQQ